MYESRWIQLNPETIAPPIHPRDAAWTTESPSPYDVPTFVRSKYDEIAKTLTIEFRYIRNEKLRHVSLLPFLEADIGVVSGRIWHLVLHPEGAGRDLKELMKLLQTSVTGLTETGATNTDIASRAINGRSRVLLEAPLEYAYP